jgi:hypothetical protein
VSHSMTTCARRSRSGEEDLEGAWADRRAGRLVAPDEGAHADEEKDEIATDVGRAGYAASAEEAAVHIVEDRPVDDGPNN